MVIKMNRKINGVVLRETPNGEKGKLLSVLTRDEGVITISATGAKNISSSYLKSVQLFAYSAFTVYEKGGRRTLTEAELIDGFYTLRNDIETLSLASYIAETALIAAVPADDGILRLVLNCFFALTQKKAEVKTVKAVYEYRLCLSLGLAPDFSGCSSCGGEGGVFDFGESLFYCSKCAAEVENCVKLGRGVASALDYLNSCDMGRILMFSLDAGEKQGFFDFCEKYLINSLEQSPPTLSFYKKVCEET